MFPHEESREVSEQTRLYLAGLRGRGELGFALEQGVEGVHLVGILAKR